MSTIFEEATIETERLRLAPFSQDHLTALNAINNEPKVMEFLSYGRPETIAGTMTKIDSVRERWTRLGFSWWTIIAKSTDRIIGAACLQHVANQPQAELEIGWRLATTAHGYGYATEAGKAAADYAFDVIGIGHVISVADPKNLASHKVMERVGMQFRGIETHYDEPCTTYVLHRPNRNA